MRRTLTLLQALGSTSPHPGLTLFHSFLTTSQQRLLLQHSLSLLSSPSHTTSYARRLARNYLRSHPTHPKGEFLPDEAYEFQQGHFDGVITAYREMLVRPGMFPHDSPELGELLGKVYALLSPAESSSSSSTDRAQEQVDPPDHLIMHLLHLSEKGEIKPHVDHLEAFGTTIVGVSLGGERIMRFRRAQAGPGETKRAPEEGEKDEVSILLKPGDAYVQKEPLRSHYTHEVLSMGEWDGRRVGGSQRLSIMLRDKLPMSDGRGTANLGATMT